MAKFCRLFLSHLTQQHLEYAWRYESLQNIGEHIRNLNDAISRTNSSLFLYDGAIQQFSSGFSTLTASLNTLRPTFDAFKRNPRTVLLDFLRHSHLPLRNHFLHELCSIAPPLQMLTDFIPHIFALASRSDDSSPLLLIDYIISPLHIPPNEVTLPNMAEFRVLASIDAYDGDGQGRFLELANAIRTRNLRIEPLGASGEELPYQPDVDRGVAVALMRGGGCDPTGSIFSSITADPSDADASDSVLCSATALSFDLFASLVNVSLSHLRQRESILPRSFAAQANSFLLGRRSLHVPAALKAISVDGCVRSLRSSRPVLKVEPLSLATAAGFFTWELTCSDSTHAEKSHLTVHQIDAPGIAEVAQTTMRWFNDVMFGAACPAFVAIPTIVTFRGAAVVETDAADGTGPRKPVKGGFMFPMAVCSLAGMRAWAKFFSLGHGVASRMDCCFEPVLPFVCAAGGGVLDRWGLDLAEEWSSECDCLERGAEIAMRRRLEEARRLVKEGVKVFGGEGVAQWGRKVIEKFDLMEM
jgi:hypothetical protein